MLETAAICIAALAALLAYFAAREARRSAKRSADASLALLKNQYQLYIHEVRLQYFSELRRWADESLTVIAELMSICFLDPARVSFSFRERQVSIINRLSALADRGRFFLPNSRRNEYGHSKDEAFRGFRHPALDQLIIAFDAGKALDYESTDNHHDLCKKIERARREFISIIQHVIETDEWVELMKIQRAESSSRHR